ncbi:hypothetical protein O4H61_20385 [Roseovarius aestuarii]|nr:hypothetical protein [Roseovarius aestuarii]
MKTHPIWYGIGFSIIPLIVLVLGYINVNPQMYRGIPASFGVENDASFSSIAWKDEDRDDPPLEYISDGFRGVGISTAMSEVTSFWSLWNAPRSEVGYEWSYKVKNLTDTDLEISVAYRLEGRNEEVIDQARASMIAEPGETVEFQEMGRLDYYDAKRVTGSTWSIGNRKRP